MPGTAIAANAAVISKARHCRSDVRLAGFGWVPVDPADVRKIALEQPPANLKRNDPKVVAARLRRDCLDPDTFKSIIADTAWPCAAI